MTRHVIADLQTPLMGLFSHFVDKLHSNTEIYSANRSKKLNTLQKTTFVTKITFILQIIVKYRNNKKFNASFQKNFIFSLF